jgi:hypothetical protein
MSAWREIRDELRRREPSILIFCLALMALIAIAWLSS